MYIVCLGAFLDTLTMRNNNINVVVLAAGKGTRMKSSKPKVLHRVCGLSLLERVIRASAQEGVSRIVVVVGYRRDLVAVEVEKISQKLGVEIVLAHQEVQNGTGGAAQSAMEHLSGDCSDVMIVPGDSPLIKKRSLQELCSVDDALTLLTQKLEEPTGFGRIIRDDNGKVLKIIEQKDCSEEEAKVQEVNTSFYMVRREVLSEALSKLTSNNAQNELYLTDIIEHARASGVEVKAVVSSFGDDLTGANSIVELSRLEAVCQKEIIEKHMNSGVSFESPLSVVIGEDVEIGADTVVGPGVKLTGTSQIGGNVTIEGSCLVNDSKILSETRLRWGCYINEASVGERVVLGPYAHLRPGTELKSEVKIGNFVETKKTLVGAGAKINHLSYVGDAEVGAGANIGAGTITCNYDGFVKAKTVIGENSFIGSNTALVAPVEVGEGAYVGAGSVITKDVPKDSLGLTRAEQKIVSGYAAKKRKGK